MPPPKPHGKYLSGYLTGYLLLLVLVVACHWESVGSEVVFHRRDHRDRGRHETARKTAVRPATNYTEAISYLQKYGYLENCRQHQQQQQHQQRRLVPSLMSGITEQVPECSVEMVREAVKRLQRRFHLGRSGRLDAATRALMGRGRCGNSDAKGGGGGGEGAAVDIRSRRRRRRETEALPGNEGSPSSWQPLPGYARSDRKRRDNEEDDWYTEGLGDWDADPHHHHHHHHHHHQQQQQQQQPGSSKRRRRELLREIADRFRGDVTAGVPLPAEMTFPLPAETTPPLPAEMTSSLRHRRRAERFRRIRKRRRKRTISIQSMGEMAEGSSSDGVRVRFRTDDSDPVRWRLLDAGVSGKIPLADQRAILELSFRMWSEVIPLRFVEAGDVTEADVVIAFAKQAHMNCYKPFDGLGGELAHSWTAGDIHFDEDENYKRVDPSGSGSGIDLLKVAVHEVGHVLGLLHKDQTRSIMYPIYVSDPTDVHDDFELSLGDRRDVQKIYGVCKGPFDVVFDWLRRVPGPASREPQARTRYIFNTYFFRNNRYWMYENRFNRTRFGDPLYVSQGWTGIPDHVNAYAQVITAEGGEYNIDTYFFVGDSYYKYNDEADRAEDGYPRKISADFGPKSSEYEAIPNDLDAVLFDNRDSLLYFFKGQWVWTYDPQLIGRNGCCEGERRLFADLFPVSDPSASSSASASASSSASSSASASASDRLDAGDVDAVFYSYHFHTVFFVRGETVYENTAYDEKIPGVNRLTRLGAWYQMWFDICDVE